MGPPRILLSAGEPSGDLHGAAVAAALRRRWPDAKLYGLGGPLMRAEGVELLAHVDDLAVMGFAEVAARLPFFLGLLRRVRLLLRTDPPDLVIPIDYPGFNLRLARYAHDRSIPVLYYIAPQVWAWHRSRIGQLARVTDRLAVILPFEAELFRSEGADARFVGHPLLDVEPPTPDRTEFCEALGIDPASRILALFPGSRTQEVERHLEPFTRAGALVNAALPSVQPVIAAGSSIPEAAYAGVTFPIAHDSWALLHHAAAAIVKSGTSTLQAALALTPMVIAYRTSTLTYAVARRVVRVDHIGLANLVAGERVAPELVQDAVTGEALAAAVLPLLDTEGQERAKALEGLGRVRAALAPDGGSGNVADQVASLAAELIAP